jgi:hypothetical protein
MADRAGFAHVPPIIARTTTDEARIRQDGWEVPRLIDRPSFQQQHGAIGVLTQPCGQHRPSGAPTDDDRINRIMLHRSPPSRLCWGLLRVRGKDLSHQGREGHIERGVHVVGQRAGVVLQDLNHRGGIVRDDDTRLR